MAYQTAIPENIKKDIDQVSVDDIKGIRWPSQHFIQQSVLAAARVKRLLDEAVAAGMDPEKVEYAISLSEVCRDLQSQASMISFPTKASMDNWQKGMAEAEYLLWDVRSAMEFAFMDHPDLLQRMRMTKKGGSHADTIQDCNDTQVLAEENRTLLEADHVRYDMNNVKRLGELADELALLRAEATLDQSTSPELTLLRDKAFTLLKENVDVLNAQARYIFRTNRALAESFRLEPPRRKPRRGEKAEAAEETAA